MHTQHNVSCKYRKRSYYSLVLEGTAPASVLKPANSLKSFAFWVSFSMHVVQANSVLFIVILLIAFRDPRLWNVGHNICIGSEYLYFKSNCLYIYIYITDTLCILFRNVCLEPNGASNFYSVVKSNQGRVKGSAKTTELFKVKYTIELEKI